MSIKRLLLPIALAAATLLGGCYYPYGYPGYGYGYGYGRPVVVGGGYYPYYRPY